MGTLLTGLVAVGGISEAATVVTTIHALASNPIAFNLDAAVDAIIDKSGGAVSEAWAHLWNNKIRLLLTLSPCVAGTGKAVEFKVKCHTECYVYWLNDNGPSVIATAKHLAMLTVALNA